MQVKFGANMISPLVREHMHTERNQRSGWVGHVWGASMDIPPSPPTSVSPPNPDRFLTFSIRRDRTYARCPTFQSNVDASRRAHPFPQASCPASCPRLHMHLPADPPSHTLWRCRSVDINITRTEPVLWSVHVRSHFCQAGVHMLSMMVCFVKRLFCSTITPHATHASMHSI